jgi:hypothetical protein
MAETKTNTTSRENVATPFTFPHCTIISADSTTPDSQIDASTIMDMDVYESITHPGITGRIKFFDWQGAKEFLEIFAGDTISFEWGQETGPDGESDSLIGEYIIYGSSGDETPKDTTYNITEFFFCSPWLIEATTRQISKAWEKRGDGIKISDMVKDLIVECGGTPGTIIPTQQKLERFVSPYWTPLHIIRYFMGHAMDEQGRGGYTLWTDIKTGNVNFTPIAWFFEGNVEDVTTDESKKLTVRPQNFRFAGKIHAQTIESEFDILKYINSGIPNSEVYSFDYDRTSITKNGEPITDYAHPHLSSAISLPLTYEDKKYISSSYSTLWPNTAERMNDAKLKTHSELVDGKIRSGYTYLFSDIVKISMLSNANITRRAGSLVKLNYMSIESHKAEPNLKLTGSYLIREIRHSIVDNDYFQVLTICNDGYKEMGRLDMIEW